MTYFSESIRELSEQLESVKDEKKTCEKKSEDEIRRLTEQISGLEGDVKLLQQKINEDVRRVQGASKQGQAQEKSDETSARTAELLETLRAAAQPVEGESNEDQKRRTLDVIHLLREHGKPEMWRHVAEELGVRNVLDLGGVLTKDDLVDVEYLLASGVASDVTELK
ncbi:hypothetical protein LSAT2_013998 [Lamellibrachia satsuma]|nr:hypothetical protein LSAT2_013998 [Lamellibrachia satsuma]